MLENFTTRGIYKNSGLLLHTAPRKGGLSRLIKLIYKCVKKMWVMISLIKGGKGGFVTASKALNQTLPRTGQCGVVQGKMWQSRFLNLCRVFIILSILLSPSIAAAAEIVAIQSINIKPYNNALRGFENACNCNVKRFVVSEMEGVDIVKKIHEAEPDIILAIGIDALKRAKRSKNTPIVYIMILNPQSVISNYENITGISMNITPKKQLAVLQQALPDMKSIGLLYNPRKTGYFVKKAQLAATAIGIELIAKEIHSSKDVPALLKSMKGEINAFWMLPDVTVVTPETVEFLFLFSFENRIPVITFSDKYLEIGALMSLDIDTFDIGKQAWKITKKILSGTDIKKIAKTDTRKTDVTINQKAAKKLGITISDEILNKARVINRE